MIFLRKNNRNGIGNDVMRKSNGGWPKWREVELIRSSQMQPSDRHGSLHQQPHSCP
jgi:hypothetical protein